MSDDTIDLPDDFSIIFVYRGDETRVIVKHPDHGMVHQQHHYPGFEWSDWTFRHVGKPRDWSSIDDAINAMDNSGWIPAVEVADAIREVQADE
jgi:hypothetical protein